MNGHLKTGPLQPNPDMEFIHDLAHVINKHSRENGSNTPDFILAEFLAKCLAAFDQALNQRARWYGYPVESPGVPAPARPPEQ